MPSRPSAVVFTDIDGTLVDHDTYEPGPARDAVARLQRAGIPIVPCSAKTAAEQVVLRADLGLRGPYIVENGAAVLGIEPPVILGLTYGEVRLRLRIAAETAGVGVRGYGDMSIDEIVVRTGLGAAAAQRAADRHHSETFLLDPPGAAGDDDVLSAAMAEQGLRLLRGARFLTAAGPHDKGTAVRALLDRIGDPIPRTFGIGDYLNDADMLSAVDVPMLVQRPGGTWADLGIPGLVLLPGAGPVGWAAGADRILATLPAARTR
jgi:mannosyl-3-phosphoglycerate phosphatase family protein